MSVSVTLLSLLLRGTQLQPDLLGSMTAKRRVQIKEPKVLKGVPVVIIIVIITTICFCLRH